MGGFDAPHRQQFQRLVQALRLSPEAGVIYGTTSTGQVLRQVSGEDLHVIYTITYGANISVFIVIIEHAPWTPRHVEMP